uniref:Homing endonuclease LAGLIDADG domain-containing protein n=1 Tax=Hypsizygus marmoreus TaxID=39966 RepID=A0A4P8D2Q8_HYPMA|nr:hypothetical protein [Hypsizygus marmoreus]QKJ80206.1 hypothetical protein [Hypsizygus marmoreus]
MNQTSITPYFVFTQTQKRFGYVWFVFQQLSHYCGIYPFFNVSAPYGSNGNRYYFMQVRTRSYPIMLTLYDMFYTVTNKKAVKTINYGLLSYLDDIALAYWAMDDGAWTKSGFYLHTPCPRRGGTKGFTFLEVYRLIALLHYKFSLVCSVQDHDGRPVIYIKVESMNLFRSLVTPHFHPTMMYKLRQNAS